MTHKVYHPFKKRLTQLEIDFPPTLTVPDQSLTIQEILTRNARGLDPSVSLGFPIYDEDSEDFTAYEKLDLSELQDLSERLQLTIHEKRQAAIEARQQQQQQQQNQSNESKESGTSA